MNRAQHRRNGGFSLIELLIVVVILAIIAAIVIPQLSASTDDAKASALTSNLARIRTAIDLYYQQHSDYPGSKTAVAGSCPGSGTAGAGTAATAAEQAKAFAEQLTMYTNAAGQACSTTDTSFRFGPYLKAAELGLNGIPKNPITDNRTVVVVSAGDLNMTGNATAAGWKYDSVTGKFIADDAAFDDL